MYECLLCNRYREYVMEQSRLQASAVIILVLCIRRNSVLGRK